MTQTSRPTAQHTDNYPDGDSGPYSSLQWRTVFKTMFTTDDDQGPIAGHLNELEVTNPIGKTIRVASGGAVVGGNIFFNDANVDFSPPNPAGAARYDYVVACLNDTDTVMTVSDAGRTLAFPTDLTDYNSASSIQEYTSRLAIVRGAEGGGLPTLDQNDDHYMIPLASYLISTGGAVSNLTDRRQFIVPRSALMRRFFVPCTGGYNVTDGTALTCNSFDGWSLPDNKECRCFGKWRLPFTPSPLSMSTYAIGYCGTGSGDIYIYNSIKYAGCGETAFGGTLLNDDGAYAYSVDLEEIECMAPTTGMETSLEEGDFLWLTFVRQGNLAADTLGNPFSFIGWEIRLDPS